MNPNYYLYTRAQRTAQNLTIKGIEGLIRHAQRTITLCNEQLQKLLAFNLCRAAHSTDGQLAIDAQRATIEAATADLTVAQEALAIRKGKLATGTWGGAAMGDAQ